MNFGKFDAMLLLTMSLAVLSMSFVFPALGLTGSSAVDDNEIPEFTVETDRFDLAGDFPDPPGTPDSGTLNFDSSQGAEFSDNTIWLRGDTDGGTEIVISDNSSNASQVDVFVTQWDNGDVSDEGNVTLNESESGGIEVDANNPWGLLFTADSIDEPNYKVTWEAKTSPDDREGLLGSVFGIGDAVAQVVAFIGSVILWFFLFIFDVSANLLNGLLNVTQYVIGLTNFLVSTYTSVVSASQGFASVFVALPGIILGIILAKVVLIAISLLPTT